MKFDKSHIYTTVNADELKIGSKCIFADTVKALRRIVQDEDAADYVKSFVRLYNRGADDVFVADDSYTYDYAYLIEPPKELEYRPFENAEKAMEAIKKHGGWIDYKCYSFLVTAYDKTLPYTTVYLNNRWYSLQELYDFFVFADDGSPCGELVEE